MGEYTDAPEDNILNISDKQELNNQEAKGILRAEDYIFNLDLPLDINPFLIKDIHHAAFHHLYLWAGKFRTSTPTVGNFLPPPPSQIPGHMYQYTDEVNHRYNNINNEDDLVRCLAYAHHRLVWIHPFTNGNGRTSRLFTDLLAYSKGYQGIQLYQRDASEDKKKYLQAIRQADILDYSELENMIRTQLRALE
ncbi:Fic/DOC family protein [Adhaeribacter aquaticus]|uniref:Fic/DOC family protein n=1 Tax=Adhaeribacter aquaticus TaxID=299567 RepID=UPI000400D29F|nr:Fic family protein [Adhaeribacter aquaticus]